jgi:serine/threonine protein kinase
MATGQRPFAGVSSAELASSILRDIPPLVTQIRSDLPAELARIIRRCLEKDPRQRVQTARDLGTQFRDLSRRWSRPLAIPDPTRPPAPDVATTSGVEHGFWVAVLPFKYGGSNADLKALGDGLTEDIVTGLCRFSYLKVISRSLTSHYSPEAIDVRSIGKELGARYVMEGSLRQAGLRFESQCNS